MSILIYPAGLLDLGDVRPDDVLALGVWCEPGLEAARLQGARYISDVWADRSRISVAEEYCWGVCVHLLPRVGDALNRIHGFQRPQRYWDILLAPWLMHLVHVLYDRHLVAEAAHAEVPHAAVAVPHRISLETPTTWHGWHRSCQDDDWNVACFAELLGRLGHPRREVGTLRPGGGASQARGPGTRGRTARFVRQWGRRVGTLVSDFRVPTRADAPVVVTVTYHLTPGQRVELARRLPGVQFCRVRQVPTFEQVPVDGHRRVPLGELEGRDDFERLVVDLLPVLTPQLYVEAYSDLCHASRQRWGTEARHCVVDGLVGGDDTLVEFVARARGEGRKVAVAQHGGGYGYFGVRSLERLEVGLTDTFLSWGWTEEGRPGTVHPLPHPHLSRLEGRARGGEAITLTEVAFPRYVYRLMTCPLGGQARACLDAGPRFLEGLPNDLRSRVVRKPYPVPFGWPSPRSVPGGDRRGPAQKPAWELNRDARISVVTYPDSAFVESLVLDTPTVAFWDPHLWEMRPAAEPLIQAMADAGIVHADPASAAGFVAEIYADPRAWWKQSDVREAREGFLARYGWADGAWASRWADFLETWGWR